MRTQIWLFAASKLHNDRVPGCTAEWPYCLLLYCDADLRRMILFGEAVQTKILYIGFFSIFIVMFGWINFKRHYSSTILISLLASSTQTLYHSFFLLYDPDNFDNNFTTTILRPSASRYVRFCCSVAMWNCCS